MVRPLGDLHRLLCMPERVAEPPQMGEQEPKPRVRPSLEEAGQRAWVRSRISPEELERCALVRESLDGFEEDRRGLLEVATSKVCLSQPVFRFDLETQIAERAGDVERLSARLEGAPMVAHVAETGAHVGEDEPEPAPIAKRPRQDFGLSHVTQDAVVLA